MIPALWSGAEEIIRSRGDEERPAEGGRRRRMFGYFVACACTYGALMGTFGGIHGERLWMVLFSAAKVPLLLMVTGAVCLPSFFVLNTILGVREDFSAVVRALLTTQASFAIILLSLSPYTLFWYASSADYNAATLFNALIFAVASFAAQWLLRRHYQPLIARNSRHRLLLRIWLVLFAFVGIQTAWMLRPFVGSPDLPIQFVREEAWGNAYVAIAEKVRDFLRTL